MFRILTLFPILNTLSLIHAKIDCGSEYNTKSWTCDAFDHYLSYKNIEKTLYCIGYDKTVSPNDVFGIKTPTWINYLHSFTEIVKIDDANRRVKIKDFFWAQVFDLRLNFNCSNINFEPMEKYFVKELAFLFWFPIPSSNVTVSIKYDVSAGMWSYPITSLSNVMFIF